MTETMTVTLDETMKELVRDAIEDGLGASPEEIVLLALRDLYSNHLLSRYGDEELQRIGREAIDDTRPGVPAEEVFAKLEALCETVDAEHRNVNAA